MSHLITRRDDIDGLRAISVVAVILDHLGLSWFPGGFVGVDVFFVISGYLITGIILRESDDGSFSFLEFYERRIRRLYPALLVVLAVSASAAWCLFPPRDLKSFGLSLVWTPLFASNFVFMGQTGYFEPAAVTKPLLHTWSLGVEEQYYLLFPLVLLGAKRFGLDRRRIVLGLVAASFAASVIAGLLHLSDAYYLLPMRFWELGCGALLAIGGGAPRSETARATLGVVGLALVVASTIVIDETFGFPGWVAALPVTGACAVLASATGPAARLLSTRPFVFVGRISYPAYLWHWPPIVFCRAYFYHAPTAGEAAGIALFTLAAAWATTTLLENPIRGRRFLVGRGRMFAFMTVGSLALVGVGAAFASLDFPLRLTPEQLAQSTIRHPRSEIAELCPQVGLAIAGEGADCLIGRRDDPNLPIDFVVLGDSHAYSVAGMLHEVATTAGRKGLFFGRPGCPPFGGIRYFDDDALRCEAHFAASLARIRAEPAITDVIVVSRWTRAVTGDEYGRPRSRPLPLFDGGRKIAVAERFDLLKARLGATLDLLSDRTVHLVAPTPEIAFDVPAAIINALRLGRPMPPGPSRAEHVAWEAAAMRLLTVATEGRPRTRVLDPTDLFCGSGRCDIRSDQGPLYVDGDHLSPLGAERLTPIFARALKSPSR